MKVKATFLPQVKKILLENRNSEPLVSINDVATLTLEDLIVANVQAAVVACYRLAPLTSFSDGIKEMSLDIKKRKDDGGGEAEMETTLCRIVRVSSSSWKRMVTDVEFNTPSARFDVARDPLNGTTGTADNPYALVLGRSLIVFPAVDKMSVSVLAVPQPTMRMYEIDCDDALFDAACLYTAAFVLMAKGDANADRYVQAALATMGVTKEQQ